MYLATLAILQSMQIPKNVSVYSNPVVYDAKHWQCHYHPSEYSQLEIERKCSGILPELNVCCAVWNDCFEMKKGFEQCNRKLYECNQIVLATANPDDFSSCRDLPAEIKRHYDYVLPRFKNLVIPTGSLVMSDSYPLQDLYQKCPFKRRTFFACMHYEKLRNYISADTTSLEAISDNLNTFDLETCLQMNLEEDEDGKDCKNSVNSFLDLIRKEDRYMNLKVKKINDNSVWKCGANQFDTHVTQILTGHGCLWLKEAFNTCCKHQKECYQEFEDKERCDESWNSCNRAVITNYDNSIADECLPFYTWVENFQKLNNVFYYKQKRSYTIWSPDNDLIFWIGTSVLVIFMLIFLTILIIISKKCVDYNSEYKQCVGKELLVRAESSETIRSL